ncbi:MAG: heavy-metal-associated domain-containing protein [Thermoplasmata archaeon]
MVKKEIILKIYGMTCEDCAATITRSLNEKEGVRVIEISFEKEYGKIVVDTDKIEPEQILRLPVFSGKSHYRASVEDDQK